MGFLGAVISRFSPCSTIRPTCNRFSLNCSYGYLSRKLSVARNPFDRASPRVPLFGFRWLSSNSTETSSMQQDHKKKRKPQTLQRVTTRAKMQRLNGYLAYCDTRWDENFQKLRAIVERTKQKTFPENRQLRMWLHRQHFEYNKRLVGKNCKLNDERVQKLQSLGFTMQTQRERSWEKVYQQLCDYVKRNNGIFPYDADNFDSLDAEGQRLHDWCQRQRVQYNRYQMEGKLKRVKNNRYHQMDSESRLTIYMTEERISKLNKINFSWSIRELGWDEKFKELKAYHEHHGDCLVPSNYVANPSLAKWVETQRRQYALSKEENKQHSMTDRRLALLSELDFAWDAKEAKWQLKYNELIEYQNFNGHGVFPRSNDPAMASLYRWLNYQRKAYHKWVHGEKSSMSLQRKEMLDRLAIVWTDLF